MSYDTIWGRPQREMRGLGQKAWKREGQEPWEAKWQGLSAQARFAFLDVVKGPARKGAQTQPNVAADKLPPKVLEELVAAGFVEVRSTRVIKGKRRIFAVEDVYDFAVRVRSLHRYHLLDPDRPSGELERFVKYCYEGAAYSLVFGVLHDVGIQEDGRVEEALQRYVAHHRWPGWIVQRLKDPLAGPLLAAIRTADGPIPRGQIPPDLAGTDAAKLRATLEALITHLALFEDLRPGTWELVVGLLPPVRAELEQAAKPRPRPPLVACERPKEFGPEEGLVVADLRAFLLELAGEPARLRQDRAIFQKDADRISATLKPVPEWLETLLKTSSAGRLEQALRWARDLSLVKEKEEAERTWLHLAPKGHEWLARPLELQYGSVFDTLRAPPKKDRYDYSYPGDSRFLGVQVMVDKTKPRKGYVDYWTVKPEQVQELRDALYRALAELPLDVFHRWDSVRGHLTYQQHNPLLLGLDQDKVVVHWGSRPVPALEERLEEVGRLLLDEFAHHRLIPLGCLRVAIDGAGELCVARHPRLDAYFGREMKAGALGGAAAAGSRVIVQPDFSVVIIGLNPAPAVALAPFCERVKGTVGQGAMTLKITRESVVKAVTHGLKAAEIVARLERHAGNGLPANVRKEVQGWCAWVRRVEVSQPTLIRCPDRDTADRAAAALGKTAERLGETTLVLPASRLTPADRQKLLGQGLIVGAREAPAEPRPVVARKKRGRRW
jgi:hypothetical protein